MHRCPSMERVSPDVHETCIRNITAGNCPEASAEAALEIAQSLKKSLKQGQCIGLMLQ